MIFSNTQELFSEVIGFLEEWMFEVRVIARVASFISIFPHRGVGNERIYICSWKRICDVILVRHLDFI
jgi:hypothetical protein